MGCKYPEVATKIAPTTMPNPTPIDASTRLIIRPPHNPNPRTICQTIFSLRPNYMPSREATHPHGTLMNCRGLRDIPCLHRTQSQGADLRFVEGMLF